MTKKRFFSVLAVALMAIFAVGCVFMSACKKVKDTEPEHEHSYTSEVTTPATCTEDGVMTWTCVDGDDSYTEAIPATGHSYGEWTGTAATCTADADRSRTCAVCGDVEKDDTKATGHKYVVTFGDWNEDGADGYTTTVTVTCSNDEDEAFVEDTDYTVTVEESDGIWTARVTLMDDDNTVIGEDMYEPEKSDENVELPISIDFSDPTSYSWIKTTEKQDEENEKTYEKVEAGQYSCGPLTFVAGGDETIGKEAENSLNTNGSGRTDKGRYFILDVSEYVGRYISFEIVFASNSDGETRSMLIDTALYNSDNNVKNSTTCLKKVDSTSKTDIKTLSYSKLIEETDNILYIVSYKSVNIYSLEISVSDEDPSSSLEHVHDYHEYWTWTPTDDGYEVSLTLKCEGTVGTCDAEEIASQTAVAATLDETSSTAATCTANGQNVYTVKIELNGGEHTDTKTDVVVAGHTWPEANDTDHVVWDWESTPNANNQVTVTISCSICGETLETLTTTYSVNASDQNLWYAEVAGANGVTYTSTHEIPQITSLSVETEEGLISALATGGNLEITLTQNISDDASATLLSAFNTALASGEKSRTIILNLGTNTLTLSGGNSSLFVGSNNTLEIVGEKNAEGKNTAELVVTQSFGGTEKENITKANICADNGSKLTLENIKLTGNGTTLYVCAEAVLSVNGCDIFTTGAYGVGTNAVESENVTINLKDSTVTVQKPDDPNTTTTYTARVGVFVNVPSDVKIEGCVITSTFQGLVLRGGTAIVTGTEIVITEDFDNDTQSTTGSYPGYENYYTEDYGDGNESAWGGGNTLPHAAIVVGNNGSDAYNNPATLTLEDVEISINSSNAWAIYAYSCSEAIPVVINIKNSDYSIAYLGNYDLDTEGTLHVYCGVSNGGSISINGEILGYEPDSYTIVYSYADITDTAKTLINNNGSDGADAGEQKGHQDGETADLFGNGVVIYILRNGKGSVTNTCLNTDGGAYGSSNAINCLKIDLSSFAGKTVTVSVEFDSNESNKDKGVALSKSQKQYNALGDDDVLGESMTTVANEKQTVEWTREAGNELETLFFICEASLNIYTITLTIS